MKKVCERTVGNWVIIVLKVSHRQYGFKCVRLGRQRKVVYVPPKNGKKQLEALPSYVRKEIERMKRILSLWWL